MVLLMHWGRTEGIEVGPVIVVHRRHRTGWGLAEVLPS